MKKRIGFTIVCFLFALLCSLAILCPRLTAKTPVPKKENLLKEYTAKDLVCEGCRIDAEGNIVMTDDGKAPGIILKNIHSAPYQTVYVNYTGVNPAAVTTKVFYSQGGKFGDNDYISGYASKNTEGISFVFPEAAEYSSLKIMINTLTTVRSVAVYAGQPDYVTSPIPVSPIFYVLAGVIAVAFGIAAYFLDKRFSIAQTITDFFVRRRRVILIGAAVFVIACIAAVAAEALIGKVILKGAYNWHRAVFIGGILLTAAFLVLCRGLVKKNKIENIVFVLVLIFGTVMILVSPLGHISWDEGTHLHYALDATGFGTIHLTEADSQVYSTESNFYKIPRSFEEDQAQIQWLNAQTEVNFSVRQGYSTIAHIPAGVTLAVTRFLGMGFYARYDLGRFVQLLVYAFLIYFAVKKLKSGKMILSVIALFPTNIFLASVYSYDYWVTGFALLGMAYFVGERQRYEEAISMKDTVIMCGAFALACLPKLIYAPLLLIPLFMKKKDFTNRKKYYRTVLIIFALTFILLLLQSFMTISGGGDTRGRTQISTTGQITYIFTHFGEYLNTLGRFLADYLSLPNMNQFIANFAYLGADTALHSFTVLLIIAVFTDKSEDDIYINDGLLRTLGVVFYIGMAILIATALYIDFTPVGLHEIQGCQPRYLLPVLYPMAAFLGSAKIRNNMNPLTYCYGILGVAAATTFYYLYTYFLALIS